MTNKEFNKSKEEKRQMFFDMQEHPDRYTDEQVERLLADEDVKDFFHDMAMVRMAMKKGNPKKVNVDEAWKKFADKQGLKANEASDKTSSNHWKIAASIIGVVFLSGITFAAIHSGIFCFSSSDEANQAKTEQVSSTSDLNRMDSIKVSVLRRRLIVSTSNLLSLTIPSWAMSCRSLLPSIMSRWNTAKMNHSIFVSSSIGTRLRH